MKNDQDTVTPTKSTSVAGSDFMMPPPKQKQFLGPAAWTLTARIHETTQQQMWMTSAKSVVTDVHKSSSTSSKSKGIVKGPEACTAPPPWELCQPLQLPSCRYHQKTHHISPEVASSKLQQAQQTNQPTNQPTIAKPEERNNHHHFDLQKDEWQAPKDQDGSGMTKLKCQICVSVLVFLLLKL